jgi:hypothetical protein
MIKSETKQYFLELKVPGRYVVYPPNVSVEQAEKVLLSSCTIKPNFYTHAELLMIGAPITYVITDNENTITNHYNHHFTCPDSGNGVGFGIWYRIEPEQIQYLKNSFDMFKDWFRSHADRIEPQFLEVREEIERYIKDDFTVWPMKSGFIEWFISNKIGGFRSVLTIPFDEQNNIISGGHGAIKFNFRDLDKLVDLRLGSDCIYEYTEFRQKEEDAKRANRDVEKDKNNFDNFLSSMKNERIQIDRLAVLAFIESVDENSIIRMTKDGEPYSVNLQDHFREMLVIVEQAMGFNEPLSVYNALINGSQEAQKALKGLNWDREKHFIRNSFIGIEKAENDIKTYELVVQFWDLLRNEYTNTLLSLENKQPLQIDQSISQPKLHYNKQLSPDEMRRVVREILAPLSGYNPQKQQIMSTADYQRLIEYTDHLVITNTLPANIQVINQTNISNKHIRFTFYRLHKRLFTTASIRPSFILLIHSLFRQFENALDSTTRTKFSEMPPSYFGDFGLKEKVI